MNHADRQRLRAAQRDRLLSLAVTIVLALVIVVALGVAVSLARDAFGRRITNLPNPATQTIANHVST